MAVGLPDLGPAVLGGNARRSQASAGSAGTRPSGARVIGVPLTKVLHLKSAVTALPDGTIIKQ